MWWMVWALVGCGVKTAPVAPGGDAPVEVAVTPDDVDGAVLDGPAVAGVDSPELRALLDAHWQSQMARSPLWATALGEHAYDDRLGDNSEAAHAESIRLRDGYLEQASGIDAAALSPADALTRELFELELVSQASADVCRFRHWSIMPRGNALTMALGLSDEHPIRETDVATDRGTWLKRLEAVPAYLDTEIAQLRVGLGDGLVANAHSLQLVVDLADRTLDQPTGEWTLASHHGGCQSGGAEADPDKAAWDAAGCALLDGPIRQAIGRYRDALRDELLPAAGTERAPGLAGLDLPDACYAGRVRHYTTLEQTPQEVHEAGLEAMRGIHDEFRAIGLRLWDTDDLAAIFERMRTDPALLFETEAEVEEAARSALADAEAVMGQAFGRLPQAACVVTPIPEYEAPYTTIAYYRPPTPGERPGTYFINTYKPETRPRHEARVLAYHESIPGHHLQIAISQELPSMPAFRKHGGFTAFVEGWALYTERLSDELGLYPSDVDRLGMLSFDAWRAGRLVVDTGLHHHGWSRAEAEAYLLENTPLASNNIANEVDRYITWPGQAVAYKTGQMVMWRLRRHAESELGDAFSLPEFHDVVLGAGAVPLPVLERRVDAWIAERSAD